MAESFFIGCRPLFIYKTYRDISVRSSQVENFRQSFKLQLSQKYLSRKWPFQKIPLLALKYFDRNFQAVPRFTTWTQFLYIIKILLLRHTEKHGLISLLRKLRSNTTGKVRFWVRKNVLDFFYQIDSVNVKIFFWL